MAKQNEIKHKFIELRAKGFSFDKISKELKTSKQTLIEWSKEFKLEIQNLQAIELETLQEEFLVLKKKRIESLGKTLIKINQNLEKIDYSEIPPEKLLELKLKYLKELKNEEIPLVFKAVEKKNMLDFDINGTEEYQISWEI